MEMEKFVKVKSEIINYWEQKHFYNEFNNTDLIEKIRSMSEFKEIKLEEYLHFLDSDELRMVFEFLSDLTNHIIGKGKQKEERKLIPRKQATVSKTTAVVLDQHSHDELPILSNLPEFDISVNNEFQSDRIPAQSTPIGQEETLQQQQQQLLQTIPEETSIAELAPQQIRENTGAQKEMDYQHMSQQQQQQQFSDQQTPAMSFPEPVFTSVSCDRNEIEELPDDENDEILKEFQNLFINQENPIRSLTPEIVRPRNERMERNTIMGMDKKFRRHRDVVMPEVTDHSKYSIFPLIYYNDAIEDFYNVIMNLEKIDYEDDEAQLLTNNTIQQVSSQPTIEEGRIQTTTTIPDPTLQSLQQNDSEQNRLIETPHLENIIIPTPHTIQTPLEATDSLNQQSRIITPQLVNSGEDDIIPSIDDNEQLLGPLQQLDVIHEEIQNYPRDDNIVQNQKRNLSTDEIREILETSDGEEPEIIANQQISSTPIQQNEDDSNRNWLDILRSNRPALSYRNLIRGNIRRKRQRRRRILFDDNDIAEIIPPKRSRRTRRNNRNIAQENQINENLQSELEQQQSPTEIMQETTAGEIRKQTLSQPLQDAENKIKFERFKINLKKWIHFISVAGIKELKRLRNCTKYDINMLKNPNSFKEIIKIFNILLEKQCVKKYEILPVDLTRSQAVNRIQTILDLKARGIISIKQNAGVIEEIELNNNNGSIDVTQ